MKSLRIETFLLFLLFIYTLTSCRPVGESKDYLILYEDTVNYEYGYQNLKGEIVIPTGKYTMCFTDTFKTYAIVLKPSVGFVAIDRKENVLYNVYAIDNGPDYTSEGIFRIIENNLIGYAEISTGKIIIKPQYKCAFSFENGVAKVSTECRSEPSGEINLWFSDNWFYIDKTGKRVGKP